MAAHDNLLTPALLSPASAEGDGAAYGWDPCSWTPVPMDGSPNISMILWECRTISDGQLRATVRLGQIDEFLPEWCELHG